MSTTVTTERITWFVHECIDCSVRFAVTDFFDDRRRADKKNFYCPNGHSQAYLESESDRLRKQLAKAEGNRKAAEERVQRERDRVEAEKRQHAATKGQLTKTKKRISGGVCPCCNRSFVDLGRHMSGEHPDYVEADK